LRSASRLDLFDQGDHDTHDKDERLIRFGNLESYDINGNKEYAHAFALDSQVLLELSAT